MPEGMPAIKPIDEDAAHFLIRQVRAHPHQVTIYAAGPLTNIALAIAHRSRVCRRSPKASCIMGGSLNPQTNDPEFATSPRHEFNFWFDPEAAHIVLRADWPRIDVTTVDVSIKAPFTQQMLDAIAKSQTPAARYIAAWSQERYYMWDELEPARGSTPRIITKEQLLYMDVDLSHGPSYGDTLTWPEKLKPATGVRLVHAQIGSRSAALPEDVCGSDDARAVATHRTLRFITESVIPSFVCRLFCANRSRRTMRPASATTSRARAAASPRPRTCAASPCA